MIRQYLSKLLRKSETSGLANPQAWLRGMLGGEKVWTGETISAEDSLECSIVTACTRLLSESVASLPLHVYRREGQGKVRATDHPLYSILHTRPNPYQTSYAWRAYMMVCVLLRGNAYSIIERDLSGRVTALWPIDPRNVVVRSDGASMYFEVTIRGKRIPYEFGDILHIKGFSLDGVTGMSVISLAKQGIGLDLVTAKTGANLYKNGMRPSIVMQTPHTLNKQTRDDIRAAWAESNGGASNAGKLAIAEAGTELKNISITSSEAQYIESRQFSVQDICRFFKVNPHLVGDPSRLAYASSEAEFNAYLVHSLGPWLVNIQAEMNATLLPDRTTFLVEFDPNGAARGSQKERYDAYQIGLDSGFLTIADVRASENLPFIPGTDQLKQPAALPPGDSNAIAA